MLVGQLGARTPARRAALCAVAGVVALAPFAGAGSALAGTPGLSVDSPASKEYAIPLSHARGVGSGGPGTGLTAGPGGPAATNDTLFGQGIHRATGRAGTSGSGGLPTLGAGRGATPAAALNLPRASSTGGGSDWPLMATLGAGVLIVALGGAVLLRGSRIPAPPRRAAQHTRPR